MSFLKPIKTFWIVGASYFTAITVTLCVIYSAVTDIARYFDPSHILLILMLSFIMALGSAVYRVDELNRTAAICLHAVIYVLGFVAFFWASGFDFTGIVVGTLILTVVYAAATVTVRLIERAFKKKTKPQSAVSAAMKKSASKTATKAKPEQKDEAEKSKKKSKKNKEEYKNLFS